MKPKSRKEILDTCQNNFWNYTTLSKVMIIISVMLSAALMAYYLVGFVIPTIQGIINNEIVGWNVMWQVCLCYILYYVQRLINIIFICIGGSALCREENWDTFDFAKAWVDIYKYEDYLDDINDTSDT
jgi:hypothetical protein